MPYPQYGITNWRDDFDYAMSWDFYRALCVEHGERDPGPCEPPPLPDPGPLDHEDKGSPSLVTTRHRWDYVKQLQGRVLHAETMIREHIDKSQSRKTRP